MDKIVIIGSPGAGKTTLALQLGEILKVPVFHLDRYFWLPGWIEKSRRDRRKILKGFVQQEQWIIEGTYLSLSEPRLKAADTIIFLDISFQLCLHRIVHRHYKDKRQPRPDLPDGCLDRLNGKCILKVLAFSVRGRRTLNQKLERYESTKQVIQLQSPDEVGNFLIQIQELQDAKESWCGVADCVIQSFAAEADTLGSVAINCAATSSDMIVGAVG